MLPIKNLNDYNKKHQVVYRQENSILGIDGSIQNVEKFVVARETTKEDFIKLFVENIYYLVKLDNNEKTLFFIILSKMDYKNIIFFDRSLKKGIIESGVMSKTSLYRAFNGLLNKKVLFEIENKENLKEIMMIYSNEAYIVNPNLVGKGSFRDLKQLRHTMVTDYDFEKLEIRQQLIQQEKHDGFDKIAENIDEHEIKKVEKQDNETKIVLGKKINETHKQATLFDEDEGKSEDINDTKLLIAKIELKEAELKLKKIEIEQKDSSDVDRKILIAQIELEEAQLKLKKATLLQQNSEIAQVNTGGGGE